MPEIGKVKYGHSLLTKDDIYLFREGTHYNLYEKLGAQIMEADGEWGVHFAVWAPNANYVSVVGDFNHWKTDAHPLSVRLDSSGIWEGFIPGLEKGKLYKFNIGSKDGYTSERGDPFGFLWEIAPKSATVTWDLAYTWQDAEWMSKRAEVNALNKPMSIYEVHLGSWARVSEEGWRSLSYLEMADRLVEHVVKMGFTHVEFLPVMEHPFFGSWGYQTLGYFAPSSRFGTPQDFMTLIDRLHQAGIGVILDWVPSHFPTDGHGLGLFDGSHLFEHDDPRKGYHPDWHSYIFNVGRYEVRDFLISSALFWLKKYHVDGIRVDAVASMLYLDYSREDGEWIPNEYGGNENIDSIVFLRKMNEAIYEACPGVQTFAEESTAWPMVSRPTYLGGLGFGMKWNMGWMHDTLRYFSRDPIFRKFHHNELSFSIWYAWFENFVLPLSHDEVVHGKGSLLGRMPGDDWQKFANLRTLYGYMWGHPGKKLLFMGGEIGQWTEWSHDGQIDWPLLDYRMHQGIRDWLIDLNKTMHAEPALYELDFEQKGFEWIDFTDSDNSTLSFLRKSKDEKEIILVALNFTAVPREGYILGVPRSGFWKELLNSDASNYGGSGMGNLGGLRTYNEESHGRPYRLVMTLPPLSASFFKWCPEE